MKHLNIIFPLPTKVIEETNEMLKVVNTPNPGGKHKQLRRFLVAEFMPYEFLASYCNVYLDIMENTEDGKRYAELKMAMDVDYDFAPVLGHCCRAQLDKPFSAPCNPYPVDFELPEGYKEDLEPFELTVYVVNQDPGDRCYVVDEYHNKTCFSSQWLNMREDN